MLQGDTVEARHAARLEDQHLLFEEICIRCSKTPDPLKRSLTLCFVFGGQL